MVATAQPNDNRETTLNADEMDRLRMVAELRARFLAGTLDEVLFVDDAGVDRLLNDLCRDELDLK